MGKELLVWTGSEKPTNFISVLLNEVIRTFVDPAPKLPKDVKCM